MTRMTVSEAYDKIINPLFPKCGTVNPETAQSLYNALRTITRQFMLERAQQCATGIPLYVRSEHVDDLQNIECVDAALKALASARDAVPHKIPLNTHVEDLGMSVRTTNVLLHRNLLTVEDVLKAGKDVVGSLQGFGRHQMAELEEILEFYGHNFDVVN